MSELANDLLLLAGQLDALRTQLIDDPSFSQMKELRQAAENIGQAHSGSWLGYHARVYHASLKVPPAGSRFSSEWGFEAAFSNPTTADWHEFTYEEIQQVALDTAKATMPLGIIPVAARVKRAFLEKQDEVRSLFTLLNGIEDDAYITEKLETFKKFKLLTQDDYIGISRPRGQFFSRDMTAMTAGQQVPPHESLIALTFPFLSLEHNVKEMADLCRGLARHLQRKETAGMTVQSAGTRIFIGHGRSAAWRDLKDFLGERLNLEYDEFNRVPVAGVPTSMRLQQMLDNARFAFIVMTAEDETAEGKIQARMNVVHEVGLFQGRLGMERAIVLLEEGCEEFSNIQGLGQIRFPPGNIGAKFEEIRMVLEREGMT
jgi:predicted nucleotide-binding protein